MPDGSIDENHDKHGLSYPTIKDDETGATVLSRTLVFVLFKDDHESSPGQQKSQTPLQLFPLQPKPV